MKELLEKRARYFEAKARELGLDFFPINYEVVPEEVMLELIVYGGLVQKFRHWSYGQNYDFTKIDHEMGMSKVYELIINSAPQAHAFLLDTNSDVVSTLVISHVLGHSAFFKNNFLFQDTDRDMINHAATRARRVDDYIEKFGIEKVEHILDIALAFEKNIDFHRGINRQAYPKQQKVLRRNVKNEFDDIFGTSKSSFSEVVINGSFPPAPEYDLLWFFSTYGKLEDWQKDIFNIVREESFYFFPQMMTKCSNEGLACITGDSLILTSEGIRTIKSVAENHISATIHDGENLQNTSYGMKLKKKKGLKITTNYKFTISGALEHRILKSDNTWSELRDLKVGDQLRLSVGKNIWPTKYVEVSCNTMKAPSTEEICEKHNISFATIQRYLNKTHKTKKENIPKILAAIEDMKKQKEENEKLNVRKVKFAIPSRRKQVKIPKVIDEDFATFLGYIVGDGHISFANRSFGLTSGDRESIDDFQNLCRKLFDLGCKITFDARSESGNGKGRWRCNVYSTTVMEFLVNTIGLTYGVSARQKKIPDCILRSPKNIMSKFLAAYFDCDGHASKTGSVILATSSTEMSQQVQFVLTNYGIVSGRSFGKDECWHVSIGGSSIKTFCEDIGFILKRKQNTLKKAISDRRWFINKPHDVVEVKQIEEIEDEFYDLTVDNSHKYLANGFINHNCMIHAKLMNLAEKEFLSDHEHLEFCNVHSKVVQPGSNHLNINPYFLGFTILTAIEKEWEEKYQRGESSVPGFQKMLEVAYKEDDVSLYKSYLTQEIVDDLKMFCYKVIKKNDDQIMEIVSTDVEDIAEDLASKLYHYRAPSIYISKASSEGIELIHDSTEVGTLDPAHVEKWMGYIHEIWGGVIDVETIDDEGGPMHYTYDEEGFSHHGNNPEPEKKVSKK